MYHVAGFFNKCVIIIHNSKYFITFALSYLKQWKNEAEKRNRIRFYIVTLFTFLCSINLFLRGLKGNFSYLSPINFAANFYVFVYKVRFLC
jgi:hypothetical protein